VRATSHARVGGRAEVSMGSRVEVRRALARPRVRRALAGPSRPCQLEASRDHAGDAVPAPYFKQSTGHTHTTHTTKTKTQRRHRTRHLPQRLEKYRRDLVSSPKFIRDPNNFSAKRPASSFRGSFSETEIIFLPKGQQATSERRAVNEDELHAELEQQVQRDEARRRLSHLQQLADQRRAQLQQRFADLAVHLAQRPSSRTCAEIRQRRQH